MNGRDAFNLPESMVQKTPYANLVGIYGTQQEAITMTQRLETMQYSPYIMKGPEGSLKLLVGAFITLNGAKNLQRELESKGIANQVVRR